MANVRHARAGGVVCQRLRGKKDIVVNSPQGAGCKLVMRIPREGTDSTSSFVEPLRCYHSHRVCSNRLNKFRRIELSVYEADVSVFDVKQWTKFSKPRINAGNKYYNDNNNISKVRKVCDSLL